MAETHSHTAANRQRRVKVCEFLPRGTSTRLLSPPVPGLGLGEQDAIGLTVSVCHWLQVTYSDTPGE